MKLHNEESQYRLEEIKRVRRLMHPECVAQRYCISAKSNLSPCIIPPRKDSEKEERKDTSLHSSQKAKQLTIPHKPLTTSTLQRTTLLHPRAVYPLRPHTTQYIYHISHTRARTKEKPTRVRHSYKYREVCTQSNSPSRTNLYCSEYKPILVTARSNIASSADQYSTHSQLPVSAS